MVPIKIIIPTPTINYNVKQFAFKVIKTFFNVSNIVVSCNVYVKKMFYMPDSLITLLIVAIKLICFNNNINL